MSMTLSFLPIVIMLLIVVIVWAMVKSFFRKTKTVSKNWAKSFVISYSVILFVAIVVQYSLPQSENTVDQNYLENYSDIEFEFNNARNKESFEKIDGIYKMNSWSFPIDGDHLVINPSSSDYHYFTVVVEKKEVNDGTIDLFRYATKHIANGIDYTSLIHSQDVRKVGDNLIIAKPSDGNLNMAKFHNEFTITRWTGEKMFDDHRYAFGSSRLLLVVPPNIEIKAQENINLIYSEK